MQDDRVDATRRGFLGLTVACAHCHDHKFDPDPDQGLLLAAGRVLQYETATSIRWRRRTVVDAWKEQKRTGDSSRREIDKFYRTQTGNCGEILAVADRSSTCSRRAKLGTADGLTRDTDADGRNTSRNGSGTIRI